MTLPKITSELAEKYYQDLIKQDSYESIQEYCNDILKKHIEDSLAPRSKCNRLAILSKLMRKVQPELLIIGKTAYQKKKKDNTYEIRHLYFKAIGIEGINWDEENKQSNDKKIHSLLNKQLIDVEKYLETTLQLLKSDKSHEIAVGLIAATGRRPIEVLATAKFFEVKNHDSKILEKLDKDVIAEYYLNFKGQAKRRDYDKNNDEKLVYAIGLLVPKNLFLAALKNFRNTQEYQDILHDVKELTEKGIPFETINKEVESRRGGSLRRVVKKYFDFLPTKGVEGKEVDCKSLRACYALLITKRDCTNTVDDLIWASRSVGHFVDIDAPDKDRLNKVIATLNYRYYYIDGKVPYVKDEEIMTDDIVSARVFKSDLQKITEIQEFRKISNQQLTFRYLIDIADNADRIQKENQNQKEIIEGLKAEIQKLRNENQSLKTEKENQQPVSENAMNKLELVELIRVTVRDEMSRTKLDKPTIEAKKVVKDNTDEVAVMSNEELKVSKKQGSVEEKIHRSYFGIITYNNEVATSNDERWVINNQALRTLSGCNGMKVSEWMNKFSEDIAYHNDKHGLTAYHNKRHKQEITDVIKWVNPHQ